MFDSSLFDSSAFFVLAGFVQPKNTSYIRVFKIADTISITIPIRPHLRNNTHHAGENL